MQSRLGSMATVTTCSWLFSSKALRRGLGTSTPYRTADPAGHAEDYEAHQPAVPLGNADDSQDLREPDTAKPQRKETDEDDGDGDGDYHYKPPKGSTEPLSPPKPPHPSSPRLESTGVNHPVDPSFQQKRYTPTNHVAPTLDDVSCAGIDGSPWPKEEEGKDAEMSREEKQEEDWEYFKHHKASPLSEIKMADTRKPITRATDGTAERSSAGRDVVGWLPEQLDTAEEALRRATEIWKQNAMRGIPEAPHSRVLRALRGADF